MLDEISRDIQARLDELLNEADMLRRALSALEASADDAPPSGNAAPPRDADRAGEAVASRRPATRASRRRRPSAETASTSPSPADVEPAAVKPADVEPAAVEPPAAEPSSAGPARRASRPGTARAASRPVASATDRRAVLAALAGGGAMTEDEVASATGLDHERASTALAQLAGAGELIANGRGYQIAGVVPAQRFYFRIEDYATPRVVVANLPELEAAIAVCGQEVLHHHCADHDFSRWVAGVLHNEPLAADIAAAEAGAEAERFADNPGDTVEHVRQALIAALDARHAVQR